MKNALPLPFLVAVLLAPQLCQAQWRTQTIQLQPGWNPIHLEVQPQPNDCDTLLANLPVESVWKWNRRFSAIQFATDPSAPLPEDPDWLVWLPQTDKKAFLRRLRALQANQSYLIKLGDGAGPLTVALKGQVVIPRLEWYPHGLNLVGFPVNPANPPTFAEFFKFTKEVNTSLGFANQLFRLDSQGRGIAIVQPNRDRIQSGVAYWVRTEKKPAHMASLHLISPVGALDFGALQFTRDLEILNSHLTSPHSVHLRLLPSEIPPAGLGFPELAGPLPLSYLSKNTNGTWDWIDFPAAGLTRTLAAGEKWTLRVGLRRDELAAYQPQGANGAAYQGILEVTDAAQALRIQVPVTASRPAFVAAANGSSGQNGGLMDFEQAGGLWVGQVALNQVNAPAYTTNTVIPTPAPMPLRLILHVDNTGQARLLQEVLLAWDPTLTDPPHTNGAYALYADERDLPATAEDVKRISSVGFPLMDPVLMIGGFGNSNGLNAVVNVEFDNPTNPFLHKYHPMHDNKDWDFVAYTNAVEVPDIRRAISLSFIANTNAAAHPIWGVDAVAGNYSETMYGLRAQPVVVAGSFALQRISRIDQLQGITP